ncbi:MAG: 16S rRNA processing protein RimM [candidate division NC10 bacterium]|nr:16S rRNA processing protein RimM [candidate division NC10 bacterium]
MAQPGYLILGRVIKSHGLRGEVKVACFADSWAPFQTLRRLWLGPIAGPFKPFMLESDREGDRAVVLKLHGVETPEAAAGLVGYEVAILRAEAPAPPEGAFYHYDILGLMVVHGDRPLGTVREILETPAHDVYVVRGPAGEWMLPATRVHVRRIDPAAGRIEIEPGVDVAALLSGGEESAEAI